MQQYHYGDIDGDVDNIDDDITVADTTPDENPTTRARATKPKSMENDEFDARLDQLDQWENNYKEAGILTYLRQERDAIVALVKGPNQQLVTSQALSIHWTRVAKLRTLQVSHICSKEARRLTNTLPFGLWAYPTNLTTITTNATDPTLFFPSSSSSPSSCRLSLDLPTLTTILEHEFNLVKNTKPKERTSWRMATTAKRLGLERFEHLYLFFGEAAEKIRFLEKLNKAAEITTVVTQQINDQDQDSTHEQSPLLSSSLLLSSSSLSASGFWTQVYPAIIRNYQSRIQSANSNKEKRSSGSNTTTTTYPIFALACTSWRDTPLLKNSDIIEALDDLQPFPSAPTPAPGDSNAIQGRAVHHDEYCPPKPEKGVVVMNSMVASNNSANEPGTFKLTDITPTLNNSNKKKKAATATKRSTITATTATTATTANMATTTAHISGSGSVSESKEGNFDGDPTLIGVQGSPSSASESGSESEQEGEEDYEDDEDYEDEDKEEEEEREEDTRVGLAQNEAKRGLSHQQDKQHSISIYRGEAREEDSFIKASRKISTKDSISQLLHVSTRQGPASPVVVNQDPPQQQQQQQQQHVQKPANTFAPSPITSLSNHPLQPKRPYPIDPQAIASELSTAKRRCGANSETERAKCSSKSSDGSGSDRSSDGKNEKVTRHGETHDERNGNRSGVDPVAGYHDALSAFDDPWSAHIKDRHIQMLQDVDKRLTDEIILPISQILTAPVGSKYQHTNLDDKFPTAQYAQTHVNRIHTDFQIHGRTHLLASINLDNKHWLLAHAELGAGARTVGLYDSLFSEANTHLKATKTIMSRVLVGGPTTVVGVRNTENNERSQTQHTTSIPASKESAAAEEWHYSLTAAPKQSDAVNCGLYVLVNMLHIVTGTTCPWLTIEPILWRAVFLGLLADKPDNNNRPTHITSSSNGISRKLLDDMVDSLRQEAQAGLASCSPRVTLEYTHQHKSPKLSAELVQSERESASADECRLVPCWRRILACREQLSAARKMLVTLYQHGADEQELLLRQINAAKFSESKIKGAIAAMNGTLRNALGGGSNAGTLGSASTPSANGSRFVSSLSPLSSLTRQQESIGKETLAFLQKKMRSLNLRYVRCRCASRRILSVLSSIDFTYYHWMLTEVERGMIQRLEEVL